MRQIDKAFLTIFKDLKIIEKVNDSGITTYMCFIGDQGVKHSEVVRLVKQYQDEIINSLLTTTEE